MQVKGRCAPVRIYTVLPRGRVVIRRGISSLLRRGSANISTSSELRRACFERMARTANCSPALQRPGLSKIMSKSCATSPGESPHLSACRRFPGNLAVEDEPEASPRLSLVALFGKEVAFDLPHGSKPTRRSSLETCSDASPERRGSNELEGSTEPLTPSISVSEFEDEPVDEHEPGALEVHHSRLASALALDARRVASPLGIMGSVASTMLEDAVSGLTSPPSRGLGLNMKFSPGSQASVGDDLASDIEEEIFEAPEFEFDVALFRKATNLYLQGQFDQAVPMFREAGGKLGQFFVERCTHCKAASLPWPGYYTWEAK